jgi:hypothetical protein
MEDMELQVVELNGKIFAGPLLNVWSCSDFKVPDVQIRCLLLCAGERTHRKGVNHTRCRVYKVER